MKKAVFNSLALLSGVLFVSGTALHAQTTPNIRTYAAGSIEIESVDPVTLRAEYRIRQARTTEPAAGSTREGEVIDPRGEKFITASSSKSFQPTPASLSCASPNDNCLRCFQLDYRDQLTDKRIDSFSNADDGFQVTSWFYGLAPNTPSYVGPHVIEVEPGTNLNLNLRNHISIGTGGYTCKLQNPSTDSGVLVNPVAGGQALTVTPDCQLQWDTRFAEVGAKYAVQLRVSETGPQLFQGNLFNGQPRNGYCAGHADVDLMIVVTCNSRSTREEFLNCLGCKTIHTPPLLADMTAAINKQVKASQKLLKQLRAGYKKTALASGIRRIKRGKRNLKLRTQVDTGVNATLGEYITNCERPSTLFCEAKSYAAFVDSKHNFAGTLFEPLVKKQRPKPLFDMSGLLKQLQRLASKSGGNFSRSKFLKQLEAARFLRDNSKFYIDKFPAQVNVCEP